MSAVAERYYDRAISDMLAMMRFRVGATVLDAGRDSGVHAIRASMHGCNVIVSKEDLTLLSMPDRSIEFVYSWDAQSPTREKTLGELARIMVPGGSLGLYVKNNQFDVAYSIKTMEGHNFKLTHHVAGEYSNLHQRTKGPLRWALLKLNTLLYGRISPRRAAANLLVFHKTCDRRPDLACCCRWLESRSCRRPETGKRW